MPKYVAYPVIVVGVVLLLMGIFGLSYTYYVDHRSADSLSNYCRIDFQSSYDGNGKVEAAVFSLWDYRYDDSKLEPKVTVIVDRISWEFPAKCRQFKLKERMTAENIGNPLTMEHFLQNENKLFVEIPRHVLLKIKKAETVSICFYYQDGYTVDLPLNESDLKYWQDQLYLEDGE